MVFLTSLNILDTGFLTVSNRASQASSSARVNSGSALQLKGVDFNLSASASLDKGVTPGYRPTSIKTHESRPLISVNPVEFTLTLLLNNNNIDTSNVWGINDMALLAQILRLPNTPYWKALYYPVDNAATDSGGNDSRKRDSQLIYQIGTPDTSEGQGDINLTLWTGSTSASSKDLTDVNYIAVRFENVSMNQKPDNMLEIKLTGVVTG